MASSILSMMLIGTGLLSIVLVVLLVVLVVQGGRVTHTTKKTVKENLIKIKEQIEGHKVVR